MKERLLCPSMMCANYGHLASEVRALDDAGADIFHCDLLSFLPQFTIVNEIWQYVLFLFLFFADRKSVV